MWVFEWFISTFGWSAGATGAELQPTKIFRVKKNTKIYRVKPHTKIYRVKG